MNYRLPPIQPIPHLDGSGRDFLMYQARYETLQDFAERKIKGGGQYAMTAVEAYNLCDKSRCVRIAAVREVNNWM